MSIDPKDVVGLIAHFRHEGKSLVGVIDKAEPKENAQPGNIPDLRLTIRGSSGKLLVVSMVDTYCTVEEP